ncbi:prohibitin family protein [Gorillibacterium timonense]|uniref:prohibitin family protein n=1 Tax=Gorillibacterium timonense TaxID=1689269 RepID=UPI00071D760D|nr:prohibitin family protein [Gorillibacterium timonense]
MSTEVPYKGKKNPAPRIIGWTALALVIVIVLFNSFAVVEYGHVGIRKTLGKMSSETLKEGLHLKVPFVQTIIPVNVQVTKSEAEAAAASRDLQITHTNIAVNYRVDAAGAYKLYNNVGPDYASRIVAPAIQEVLKSVTSKFTAEELIQKRDTVAVEVKEGLSKRLGNYQLIVTDISIVNFEFADAFNASIEAKQIASQKAMQAENDLKRIEIEAKQKIAQAQAEAESLRLKKQEVTPELIQLKQIEVQEKALEKWDGKLPTVTGGATPFIDLDSISPQASSSTSSSSADSAKAPAASSKP